MSDRVNLPTEGRSEPRKVEEGYFEREIYLSREDTVRFLRDLADQIEADTSFTISADDWEIPFTYADPIEVEVEFLDTHHRELEIELEFEEPSDRSAIDVS